ncbi:MAG: RIP metalloprotease RseP [Clostridia bacterium]|nr:RIP metalloprotease RseP [Clostridia bacterium]
MDISSLCLTFGDVLTYAFYIIIALVVLLIMITIHEFGHFIAGRKLGFKINEFAVGFGKILLKHTTKDGILVTLRLIPLGGYCAFEGEDEDSLNPNAFNNQPPWKRLIVLFNGAFFNFLSAVLISFVLLMTFGYGDLVQVKSVEPYATNVSELQVDDVIYEVNGVETNFLYDNYFSTLLQKVDVGEEFIVKVKRDGEFKELTLQNGMQFFKYQYESKNAYELIDGNVVVEKVDNNYIVTDIADNSEVANIESKDDDELFTFIYKDHKYVFDIQSGEVYSAYLGITIGNYVYSFGEAFVKAVPFTCEWAWKILELLWQLITGQMGLEGVGGPITTIGAMATYTQSSWINLLILFPLISVNLAVFNLLPFPALDGARMVFVAIEWIRGKPINRNIEGYIHTVGLIILFGFVILVDALNLLF